ncbi:MAG: thioredoxin family protein [Gemmataceae bacterium]|nr:thioredoxin family protein [Gemmataceae bacterium]
MRTVFGLATLAAAISLAPAANPGKFNKVLTVGDKAPAWTDLEGTDGKKHALADLKDKEVVVVVFTCNSCPVAAGYEDRIVAFAQKHAGPGGKVGVVAINVNTNKDDALPAMTERAAKKRLPYPYLYDPTQQTARQYGAVYTPEFFVLDRDRKVVYTGAMDDKAPPNTPTAHYLEPAVLAALAGKPAPTGETSAAAGCRIKFNPKKDD